MSSNGDREAVMKCLHSGAADYLVQPLRQNELQNLWTKVLWRKVGHWLCSHKPCIDLTWLF